MLKETFPGSGVFFTLREIRLRALCLAIEMVYRGMEGTVTCSALTAISTVQAALTTDSYRAFLEAYHYRRPNDFEADASMVGGLLSVQLLQKVWIDAMSCHGSVRIERLAQFNHNLLDIFASGRIHDALLLATVYKRMAYLIEVDALSISDSRDLLSQLIELLGDDT